MAFEICEEEKPDTPNHDPVERPLHYTIGEIECIDAIRSALGDQEWRGFLKGQILKYVWRELWKGGDEDVAKAGFYLDMLRKAK